MLNRGFRYVFCLILLFNLACGNSPSIPTQASSAKNEPPQKVVAQTRTPSPRSRSDAELLEDLENATDCSWAESESPQPVFTDKHRLDGKTLYNANCLACHGTPGEGAPKYSKSPPLDPPARDLADFNTYKYGTESKSLYHRICYGIEGTAMAPLGEQLSPDEVWSVVAYLETFK